MANRLVRMAALAVGLWACRAGAAGHVLYVATTGKDTNAGTRVRPLATVAAARDAIRAMKAAGALPAGGVEVRIRGGRYFLGEPLVLTPADGGTKDAPIVYAAFPGERPVLSGGRRVTGWTQAGPPGKGLWTVTLPAVAAGKWYFRQLFADGRRLRRARTPNRGHFTTVGPLSKFADRARKRWGGYRGVRDLRRTQPDAYCGFAFREGDVGRWKDVRGAEVLTFHSWECSWQTIRRIDHDKNELHLNTPCRYPVGFFSPCCRYRVESVAEALDEPGEWFLDRRTGRLSYLARAGEKPGEMDFVAPVRASLLVLAGDAAAARFVEHVTFRHLSFRHARYPMGIYDVAPDWPKAALAADPNWPRRFAPGYTDAQAAPRCGQAIELKDARHCALEQCEIARIGAYGVKIFARGRHNRVVGCHIHDAGGGGVLVGMPIGRVDRAGTPESDAPCHNVVEDNRIEHISLVHPSAVGVWVAQSHHNRVAHNEIAHVGYAGIHLGWTWGRWPNFTHHNVVEGNHIHHVMRDLADAAGIYSLGPQEGTVYRGNYIHDIVRADGAIGAPVDGLFFDQGSRHIRVERNVIRRVDNAPARFNQCRQADQTWGENDFDTGDAPVRLTGVVESAGPRTKPRPPRPAAR